MVNLFGVPFSSLTRKETAQALSSHLQSSPSSLFHVVTANPEIVMKALDHPPFHALLQQADWITPDGIGVVWAAKRLGTPLPERVAGYDLVHDLLTLQEQKQVLTRVFLLGAAADVVPLAAKQLESLYSCVRVVGWHHGYFSDDAPLVRSIQDARPDLLLVGLGSPRQEQWISTYRAALPPAVAIGCGGSFDVLAGKVRRAPRWVQAIHLEWLFRLMQQPARFKRHGALIRFAFRVIRGR